MSTSTLKKVGLVAVILAVFFSYLKLSDVKARHFKVDAKSFHVKPTKTALLKSEFNGIPILDSANRYHIMMDENVNVPLVNMRRTLHIEKVWLSESFLYVLYSVDLKNTDKTLTGVPKLNFSKIQLHYSNGKNLNVTTDDSQIGIPLPSRQTYNYRVYGEVVCGFHIPQQDLIKATSGQDFLNKLKKIDKVTLLNPTIELKNHKTSLSPITFPAKLNQDKYYVGSKPINKVVNVNGATIQFDKVNNYYNHKELDYKVINNKNHFVSLEFNVKTDGGDPSLPNTYTSDLVFNNHTMYFGNADHIKILPEKVMSKLEKPIKIKISPKVFMQLLNTNKQIKVADVLNGQIYFGFDQRISFNSFYLGFKKEPNKEPQIPSSIFFLPKNPDNKNTTPIDSTLISFKSLDGKPINWDEPDSFTTTVDDGEMKFFFNMGQIEKIDKGVSIEMDGLVYEEPVKSKPITISLK
jgi:hypothetical protein